MDSTKHESDILITNSYKQYYELVTHYIGYRINHKYEAQDLAQDVFVRLLDYKQMLRPETVKYFLFTIARNIVTDYLRRYYKKQEIDHYIHETTFTYRNDTEVTLFKKDILLLEKKKLSQFPQQRKIIYALSRFKEKSIPEISLQLNLSKRTVENHLFIGRKIMREFLKQSI